MRKNPDYYKLYFKRNDRKEYIKKYRKQNEEILKQKAREYYIQNKEIITKRNDNWTKININKVRNSQKRWHKEKRQNDVKFRILNNLRTIIYRALKKSKKSKTTKELVSCSLEELKQHLEKQFTLGMNWKNYGFGWHIDHIKPCASFDLSKPDEQKKCFHYTNLQPLWATENFKKNKNITS